jgi:hypothetical protein
MSAKRAESMEQKQHRAESMEHGAKEGPVTVKDVKPKPWKAKVKKGKRDQGSLFSPRLMMGKGK